MMVIMKMKMKRKGQRTKDEGNVADQKRGGGGVLVDVWQQSRDNVFSRR